MESAEVRGSLDATRARLRSMAERATEDAKKEAGKRCGVGGVSKGRVKWRKISFLDICKKGLTNMRS